MKKHVILDFAIGSDGLARDGYFAAMSAIRSEYLYLDAVTIDDFKTDRCVHGMLHMLQHMCLDIPVCKGANCNLNQRDENGKSTIVDPFAGRWPDDQCCLLPAVEKMAELLRNNPEKTVILCHATATNIADLILQYPELKEKIEFVSVLENRCANSWELGYPFDPAIDPEAAKIILESGVPVLFFPLTTLSLNDSNVQDIYRICTDENNNICRFSKHTSIGDASVYVLCGCADIVAATDRHFIEAVPMQVKMITEGADRGKFFIGEADTKSSVQVVTRVDYSLCHKPGVGLVDTPTLIAWNKKIEGKVAHHHHG